MDVEKYLLNEGVLKQSQVNDIANQALIAKSTFFYAARQHFEDDTELVQAACTYFGYSFIERGYGMQINVEATLQLGDIFDITKQKCFIAGDDQHFFCLIYDPTNERMRQRVEQHVAQGITFAMCSAKTYEAIYELSVRPALLSIRADGFREDNAHKAKIQASSTEGQQLLSELLIGAITQRASDIHIMPLGEADCLVRLRVDGVLRDYTHISASVLPMLRNLLITRVKKGGDTSSKPIEGQFVMNYHGEAIDVRVNIVNAKLGSDFNLRFIRSELKALDDIGLSDKNKAKYRRLLNLTKGMVIVTGPTGSGKSTLLYAGCREIAEAKTSIFAIEDPVEIVVPSITQVNIDPAKQCTYADALKSSLRHDPDVILIGEIRDRTVAEEAIRASNTGHLVFTTLHTNDALGGLSRLINIGIDPYSLGDCLAAIVAQRLVRRICPRCKRIYELPKDHEWRKKFELGSERLQVAKGDGCEACAGTGYYGRIAINEIMTITPELSRAIQQCQPKADMRTILMQSDFRSFIEDGKEKAMQGITTFQEIEPFKDDIL